MGAATEIDERDLAVLRVAVNRYDLALGPLLLESIGSLSNTLDDLGLVGLFGKQLQCLVTLQFLALETLVVLHDLGHLALDALEVLRSERFLYIEVVIEAVFDRRADRVLGAGIKTENGLSQHVSGGMAQHLASELILRGDHFDVLTFAGNVREVALLARPPRGSRAPGLPLPWRGQTRRCSRLLWSLPTWQSSSGSCLVGRVVDVDEAPVVLGDLVRSVFALDVPVDVPLQRVPPDRPADGEANVPRHSGSLL